MREGAEGGGTAKQTMTTEKQLSPDKAKAIKMSTTMGKSVLVMV